MQIMEKYELDKVAKGTHEDVSKNVGEDKVSEYFYSAGLAVMSNVVAYVGEDSGEGNFWPVIDTYMDSFVLNAEEWKRSAYPELDVEQKLLVVGVEFFQITDSKDGDFLTKQLEHFKDYLVNLGDVSASSKKLL